MKEVLPTSEREQAETFDEPLQFALNGLDTCLHSHKRNTGGKRLAPQGSTGYTEEEQIDARRALQESMDLRD